MWRRQRWGFVLAVMMCLKGATYTLALAASAITTARAAVAGAAQEIVVWAMCSLVGSLAAATMLVVPGHLIHVILGRDPSGVWAAA